MSAPLKQIEKLNGTHASLPAGVTEKAVGEALERVLSSSVFSDSSRMSRFVRFAVEETLQGNAGRLKEIVIGAEVFDRQASYDPRLDPIVRVEARRLRAKLKTYYEGEGRNSEVILDFPKGSYAPIFQTRSETVSKVPQGKEALTIAVLPFTNIDPEPDSDYFSDGLSEELTHALTRIPGLHVLAWHSAAQLRQRQEDIDSIRTQLDVAHVLRGSVRKTGRRLRITAQLINTADGRYLWSETYDRQIDDVFAIQEEIAAAIVAALNPRFWKGTERPGTTAPRNMECYKLCLRGRFHANERTNDGLRRSVVCFEQAVLLDSASASAYAGLADSYSLLTDYGLIPSSEGMPKAKAAAERALELDGLSAEPHASLGLIRSLYEWRWEQAEMHFRRALELNPGYTNAHHWLAVDHLAMLGRLDEAQEQIEIARELDPLSTIILEGRAFLNTLARRYDDAIVEFNKLLEFDPSFYKGYTSMGRAYLQKGVYGKAIELLRKGQSIGGNLPSILGALGQAYALTGDLAEARHILTALQEMSGHRPVPSRSFALIYLGMGDKDKALTHLEHGVGEREIPMAALGVHPLYDELRDEPRFQALLRRIGVQDAFTAREAHR